MSLNANEIDLKKGARVEQGSTIATQRSGRVELTFDDGTNIAIGPNSKLEITDVLMQSSNRASRFAVKAIGGSFRFISGKSDKKVYKVTTPTATMGIRGTAFDLTVTGRETLMALFNGRVNMCRDAQTCMLFSDPCAISFAPRRNLVAEIKGKDAVETLGTRFPFIQNASVLSPAFQTDLSSCSRHVAFVTESIPQPPVEAPPPPPPPPPPPSVAQFGTFEPRSARTSSIGTPRLLQPPQWWSATTRLSL